MNPMSNPDLIRKSSLLRLQNLNFKILITAVYYQESSNENRHGAMINSIDVEVSNNLGKILF